MKQLICEMCGSTDIVKQNDFFVCQSCGCKYTVDGTKVLSSEGKEIIEGIDNITKKLKKSAENFEEIEKSIKNINELKKQIKELENEVYVLFANDETEQAQYHVLEHLRDTQYVIDNIFDDLNFGHTQHEFAIIALFGGPITYHWTASSGYDREETYTEYEDKYNTVNGKTIHYREPVTKTRIVTDWRPSNGTMKDYYYGGFVVNSTDFFNDVDFRIKLENKARRALEKSLSLWQVCQEIPNGESLYETIENNIPNLKSRATSIAENSSRIYAYNIPGDHYKDVHDTADFKLESFCVVLYPIIKGEYNYEGAIYKFSVDAFDGNQNDLAVEYPAQVNDKEKHDLLLAKAEKQKQGRIAKNQNTGRNVLAIGWVIFISLMVYSYFYADSIVLLALSILGAVIWNWFFKSKFKNDIININNEENQRIEQIKHAIQNENEYKKYLRQKGFVKFISNSGNEKFIAMAKDFVPEKINADGKVDEVLSEFEEHEKTKQIKELPEDKQKVNRSPVATDYRVSKQSKKKIGICLSVIAVIIALVVAISTFGGKADDGLVGTWRADLNSSLITFEDDGDMILNSSIGDEILSYRVDGNTLTMIFANNETASFDFEVKGDTLILGEDYYTRVK